MKVCSNQDRLNELFDSDSRSLTSIAAELGVSKQAVSMWKSGARSPKKSVLVKIAKMYNVSIEWLMGFDVPKEDSRMQDPISIIVPNSELFMKCIHYMSQEDYLMVMRAFERAANKMKVDEEKNK